LIFSSPLQKNPINFLEFSGISSGGNVVPSKDNPYAVIG